MHVYFYWLFTEMLAAHSFLSSLQTTAAALYRDIDNLELHVGLQAEEIKRPGPGAGLCPGYTISRAILADAVCLTRGDRFLTVDFTRTSNSLWFNFPLPPHLCFQSISIGHQTHINNVLTICLMYFHSP